MASEGIPQMLISRHLTRLAELWDARKIEELLDRVKLTRVSGIVQAIDDRKITMDDCLAYKLALHEVFDEQVYEFACVNFILGGCRCSVCTARSRSTPARPAAR